MKSNIYILVLLLMILSLGCMGRSEIPNGLYIGSESMPSLSPDYMDIQWFHENELTIKDSTIVLYKQPFTVKNGTKTYQAADGGFYYFEGEIKKKGDRLIAVLSLNYDRSLYVPIRIDRNNKHVPITEQYEIQLLGDGSVLMDSVKYLFKNKL